MNSDEEYTIWESSFDLDLVDQVGNRLYSSSDKGEFSRKG